MIGVRRLPRGQSARGRRAWSLTAVLLSVVLMAGSMLYLAAAPALAAVTPLLSAQFTTDSTPAGWSLPTYPVGTNGACLTAGPDTTATSIPDCDLATPDPAGSGALRLTSTGTNQVGSTFYSVGVPTNKGLDVTFNSYQYDGTGADGTEFALAATDPADPAPPATTGALGGSLGYGPSGTEAGLADGYLGFGFDVYGNYENTTYNGSGCSTPTGLTANKEYPESVTVKGPGSGTAGYCMLASTAQTYKKTSVGGSVNETVNNLGGYYLDSQSATSRSSVGVPTEVVINPGTTALTAPTSGVSVPGGDWMVAVKPIGDTNWEGLTGALPSTTKGTLPTTYYPSSWVNSATGLPYQLTLGWTGSTGASDEIHELNDFAASTFTGTDPVLDVGNTDNESGQLLAGSNVTYTLSPSVASDGGNGGAESDEMTVSDTFPTGITPGTATAPSEWACTTSGQTVTCTYTPSSSVAAGTALSDITIPATLSATASGSLPSTAEIASLDGDSGTATDSATATIMGATAAPTSTPHGNAVTLSATASP
ncbi:MAG TPA: hypothetical protein VMQ59_01615, partial [Acidimicrobiales bacterium]|nr:hypothetical protein [Acidimicrobiales bacterium]